MSDTEPPDTLRENDLPQEQLDVGPLVVRNIVREEVAPIKNTIEGAADRLLTAFHEMNTHIAWMVKAIKDNRTDIDENRVDINRILDHLGLDKGPGNGADQHQ